MEWLKSFPGVTELGSIMQAMQQLSQELGGCVAFRLYNTDLDVGREHLFLAKTLNDG